MADQYYICLFSVPFILADVSVSAELLPGQPGFQMCQPYHMGDINHCRLVADAAFLSVFDLKPTFITGETGIG